MADLFGEAADDEKPATKGDEKKGKQTQIVGIVVGVIVTVIVAYYVYKKYQANAGTTSAAGTAGTGTVANGSTPAPQSDGGSTSGGGTPGVGAATISAAIQQEDADLLAAIGGLSTQISAQGSSSVPTSSSPPPGSGPGPEIPYVGKTTPNNTNYATDVAVAKEDQTKAAAAKKAGNTQLANQLNALATARKAAEPGASGARTNAGAAAIRNANPPKKKAS